MYSFAKEVRLLNKLNMKWLHHAPKGCKPLSVGVAIALSAASAIMAGAFPSDYGGIIFLALSVGLFSYVLTASFNFLYMGAGAIISVAVALVCGVKFPLCLVALCYIPISLSISISLKKRAGLSATVAFSAAVTVGLLAVAVGICYLTMKESFTEALHSIWQQYEYMMRQSAEQMNSTPAGTVITENTLTALLNTMLMVIPSIIVLICMALCYISAKIVRLAALVGDSNEMFEGGSWPVTASLAGSVVFIVSYIISMLAYNSDVIYFSAVNIMYIILPSQAIVGFKLMFSARSPVRFRGGFFKMMITFLCVYLLFANPVMLCVVAATFTSFYNIRVWWLKRKKDNEDND